MLRRLSLSAALAALAVPVLAVPVLTVPLLAVPATAADPGGPHDDPSVRTLQRKLARTAPAASRRADRVAGTRAADDAPLSVSIEQLTPSTLPDQGMVRISGFVTNNDSVTWSTINIRPFISSSPLTTPAQLAEAAAMPPDAVVGDRINDEQHKGFIAELAPGDSASYSLGIPRRLLNVSTPGVYWFGVHALGESAEGRDEFADGRARTFLPLVPAAREGQQPAAVVIPLRHQLLYTADGRVDDLDGWVRDLSQGGRLRSLVDFGASAGGRTVTWVVDPAVIDAVRRLAAGNPPRSLEPNLQPGQDDGEDEGTGESASPSPTDPASESPSPTEEPEGTGESPLDLDELDPVVQAAAQEARTWLARLGEAMRPEDQVMTLPYGDVDVAGAARHNPELYQRAVARSGGALPGFDVTTTPVLSSPSGFLSAEGIRAADPASTVLLTDAMFEDQPGEHADQAPALARTEGREVVVTSSGAAAGGPGPDSRTALTSMRQRLLAEAAVRFLRGEQEPLTMVLPHDWNPSGGATFFGGLDADWLNLTSVAGIKAAGSPEPVDGATLRYPRWQREAALDEDSFEAASRLIRSGVSLQNLLTLNNVVSGTVTDQALGSTSYSARTRPIANQTSAEDSRAWIDQRLNQVHVSAPRAVTLSSSTGQFAAIITNELDQPVTVSLDAVSDDRLSITGPRRVDVNANGRSTVLLTARTNENGIHDVRLMVTDKRGTPLGATTTLSVRSAQVSNVIWLFLAIGAALLFGAIGVRLFRRVRNARRTTVDGDAESAGAAGAGAELDSDPDRQPTGAGSR